jgi:hypothetical protein
MGVAQVRSGGRGSKVKIPGNIKQEYGIESGIWWE